MLSILWTAAALGASPAELARVRYLEGRWPYEEAALAGAALLMDDPSDVSAHVTWIQARAHASPWAAPRVKALYARWLDEDPKDPVRRVALAWSSVLAAPESEHGHVPGRPGAWCDEVLGLLAPLPDEPAVRGRALWLQQLTEVRCGLDDSASRAALLEVAEEAWQVRYAAVALRLEDDVVDADDARAVAALLEVDPWRATGLWMLWTDDAEGDGLEAARAAVLSMAEGALESDDPALVYAACMVCRAADRREDGEALAARMKELDPERFVPPWPGEGGEHEPPAPADLGTLEERLAILGSHPPRGGGGWERGAWHSERARLLEGLDRSEEALRARRHAYRTTRGYEVNLAYASAALALDSDLRRARRALDVAVMGYGRHDRGWGDMRSSLEQQAASLAESLALRAEVQRRLGHRGEAKEDAVHSLLVAEGPTAHLVLGLVEVGDEDRAAQSFEHLSAGLAAGGSGLARLDAGARAALERALPAQGWWSPGGMEGWLAVVAKPPSMAPAAEGERAPFPDLMLTVDGAERPLSSFEGPLVVDLWATWCGPCREALPQVDLLARTHPEITFIAVSVDEEPAAPEAHLRESDPAFVAAWAGREAMKTVGVSGIPAVFFLDAEHRIVTREGGFNPSGAGLDEGLRALLEAMRGGER